jgi:hypothetical protein
MFRCTVSIVCCASRFRDSTSDGVNILGTKEVAGFGFGEPVEAVAEPRLPP